MSNRYHEIWMESKGYDPHGHISTEDRMAMIEASELNRDLERLDRNIAATETSLRVLQHLDGYMHHQGFSVLMLEQEAEDLKAAGRYEEAELPAQIAKLLRKRCENWSTEQIQDRELLAGMQMQRNALAAKLNGEQA